ncbi:MAG: HD domain-containing protein [Candidatus Hermodarchaeota archaeon]
MNNKDIVTTIREFVINNSSSNDIHGFPHVNRVYNLCLTIARNLDVNMRVLKIAALLHDIGREKEKENLPNSNHANVSTQIALEFLKNNELGLSEKEIHNIIHCIKTHSFSLKLEPITLEAKILSDADKLDAIGAIGLYRTIGFTILKGGEIGDVIEHLEKKILKIHKMLNLNISRKMAETRHKIIMDFYTAIKNEINEVSN